MSWRQLGDRSPASTSIDYDWCPRCSIAKAKVLVTAVKQAKIHQFYEFMTFNMIWFGTGRDKVSVMKNAAYDEHMIVNATHLYIIIINTLISLCIYIYIYAYKYIYNVCVYMIVSTANVLETYLIYILVFEIVLIQHVNACKRNGSGGFQYQY